MKKKKEDKTTELIVSYGTETIGSRFIVKLSIMDNGVTTKSVMVIVHDVLESGFTIKYFKSVEDAAQLLNLLKAASK